MFEIAVCDDCKVDRERLIKHIDGRENPCNLRIHEYESGKELLSAMNHIQFAAVFLDIQMKELDGEETAKRIRQLDSSLVLVFYTGFAEPSPRTIEVQPYRYIMKNMSEKQIEEYVNSALAYMRAIYSMPQIVASLHRKQIIIDPKHIVFIEKYKRNTRVHLSQAAYHIYGIEKEDDGDYPVIRLAEPLENTYDKLRKYGFGCPHTSLVINLSYLRSCTGKSLKLAGLPCEFPISRGMAKSFNQQKEWFFQAKYVGGEVPAE